VNFEIIYHYFLIRVGFRTLDYHYSILHTLPHWVVFVRLLKTKLQVHPTLERLSLFIFMTLFLLGNLYR